MVSIPAFTHSTFHFLLECLSHSYGATHYPSKSLFPAKCQTHISKCLLDSSTWISYQHFKFKESTTKLYPLIHKSACLMPQPVSATCPFIPEMKFLFIASHSVVHQVLTCLSLELYLLSHHPPAILMAPCGSADPY